MQIAPKEFTVNNEKMVFRAISGTVKSTEQRSDSHTYGEGKSVVMIGQYGGGGGGSSYVDTKVVVTRDIFIEDGDRQHNIRIQADIPLATGHDISAVVLEKGGQASYYSIANRTLGKWWQVGDDQFVANGQISTNTIGRYASYFAIMLMPCIFAVCGTAIIFGVDKETHGGVVFLLTILSTILSARFLVNRANKKEENRLQKISGMASEFSAAHKQFVRNCSPHFVTCITL
jgi:hypothetical protein